MSQVAEFSFKLLSLGGNRHSDTLTQLNGLECLHCTAITTSYPALSPHWTPALATVLRLYELDSVKCLM